LKKLRPMNLYGWSKQSVRHGGRRTRARGEKPAAAMGRAEIFNVFGPQRISQGHDESVLARRSTTSRPGVRCNCSVASGRDPDGDQRRDFIYVDDVVRVMMWLLATPSVSGLFNVGTAPRAVFAI